MRLRAVPRKRDAHDIVGVTVGELLKALGDRRLLIRKQHRLAAKRDEESFERHSVFSPDPFQ
jgi:hypothetical protein